MGTRILMVSIIFLDWKNPSPLSPMTNFLDMLLWPAISSGTWHRLTLDLQ